MNDRKSTDPYEEITRRVNAIQIKLLDEIERALTKGESVVARLEAYETLCRAERTRRGL